MDDEAKLLLKEELAISRENNKILNNIVWHQKLSNWLNAIKWIVVLGTTVGALYLVQPMMNNLVGTYSDLLNGISETSVKTLPGQY